MNLFGLLKRFAGATEGNVAIIVGFVFIPMLVLAGGSIDLARYESYRVQLQNGVDRGVLAAASLTQRMETEDTVRAYMASLPFYDDVAVTFDATTHFSSREIAVEARYDMPTAFLMLIGMESMPIVVEAVALDRKRNIEISLMLDFSGSMMEDDKIGTLKPAAKGFIDKILNDDTRDYTSVSIVPYAGQVSVGKTVFDALRGRRRHDESSCFEMGADDFASGLLDFEGRAQVPHFTVWNYNTMPKNPGWCPSDDTSITFLSNDARFLKQRIDGYEMYDGTGTHFAVNWGLMLLDPSLQPLMEQAAAYNMVEPSFADRPAAYEDPETLKVIVLMTDGAISEQYTAKDPNTTTISKNNFREVYKKDTSLRRMNEVCTEAKANGVRIFTIGFGVTTNSQAHKDARAQMRGCASSPSDYFNVEGLDINAAFDSIAVAIDKLKLTQ